MIEQHATREEWLAARRRYIGSSDAAVLWGCCYASQSLYSLWCEKVLGYEPTFAPSDAKRLRVGKAMEATLRELLAESLGRHVFCDPPHATRTRGIMSASLDAQVFDYDYGREIPCELKNYGRHMAHEFDDGGLPLKVQVQVAHQMYVIDAPYAYVYCLVGGEPIDAPIRVERDMEFEALHVAKCEEFWRLVENRMPPEVDASAATSEAIGYRFPREKLDRVDGDDEIDHITSAIESASAAAKSLQDAIEGHKNRLRDLIGDHDGIISPSGVEWKWAMQCTRKAKHCPQCQFEVAPASESRVLRRVGKRRVK